MTINWTPAVLSSDLPAGVAVPVSTMSDTLALWRSASGRLSAFADRCPHRGMRLSHGFVRGETLSCIYHGWGYAPSGRCLRIPAHPGLTPPEAIRVRTHAVEEVDGLVWIASDVLASSPPRLPNLVPLRSLTVDATPCAIEVAAGAKRDAAGLIRGRDDGLDRAWLIAPQPEERTIVHVLVREAADGSERIAASRAAEALRRSVEAVARKTAA